MVRSRDLAKLNVLTVEGEGEEEAKFAKNADELVRDLFLAMAAALMKVCSHNTCYP